MTERVTADGDMVDAICRELYGPRPGAVEAVLAANPGLAARGPVLPAGVRIRLPELAGQGDASPVRLWD